MRIRTLVTGLTRAHCSGLSAMDRSRGGTWRKAGSSTAPTTADRKISADALVNAGWRQFSCSGSTHPGPGHYCQAAGDRRARDFSRGGAVACDKVSAVAISCISTTNNNFNAKAQNASEISVPAPQRSLLFDKGRHFAAGNGPSSSARVAGGLRVNPDRRPTGRVPRCRSGPSAMRLRCELTPSGRRHRH